MFDPRKYEKTALIHGWLKNQVKRFGLTVYYTKRPADAKQEELDDVYGVYSGVNESLQTPPILKKAIRVVIPGPLWSIVDRKEAGSFDALYIFTLEHVQNGDLITIPRTDGREYRFKIVQVEQIGFEAAFGFLVCREATTN